MVCDDSRCLSPTEIALNFELQSGESLVKQYLESFDSGFFLGPGHTFSFTFTQEGKTSYVCDPHDSNMYGTTSHRWPLHKIELDRWYSRMHMKKHHYSLVNNTAHY